MQHTLTHLPHATHTAPQDNALALLASPKASRGVQSLAAELLLRLLAGLQRSLAAAADPELAASAYGASPQQADARAEAVTAAAASAPPGAAQGELLQQLLAGVRGAEPTCADSYPPLPLPPAGLADAWRLLPGQAREAVDITSAVHSIVLQARTHARAAAARRLTALVCRRRTL